MANLVHNETVKLRASFLNSCGVASFVGGALIPWIVPIGGSSAPLDSWALYGLSAGGGIGFGFLFHALALAQLRRLRE